MAVVPNVREQKFARTIDREIGPIWNERFARLIWRHLPPLREGMVLDVHSGVGRTIEQLLTRLPQDVRVLGLEPQDAMRALAKSKISPEWKGRVYLKPQDASAVAEMSDDLYDLVVANLVLSEAHDLADALEGLIRVTKPGGTLLATLPMYGTWTEAEDLLREVLRDAGLTQAQNRLRRMANLRPTGPSLATILQGLPGQQLSPAHYLVEQERFTLLFGSGREFLFSPLVELGPLRLWKAVVATEGDPQQVFFRFKEAIDAYCDSGLFAVGAVAGAIVLQRPMAGEDPRTLPGSQFWRRFPELDELWSQAEAGRMPEDPAQSEVDLDFETEDVGIMPPSFDFEDPMTGSHPVAPQPAAAGSPEDDAIRALLDAPSRPGDAHNNLDALLDQVLEFDSTSAEPDDVQELDEEEVELVQPDSHKPGETLKRIRALLPPPPGRRPPPPPLRRVEPDEEPDEG